MKHQGNCCKSGFVSLKKFSLDSFLLELFFRFHFSRDIFNPTLGLEVSWVPYFSCYTLMISRKFVSQTKLVCLQMILQFTLLESRTLVFFYNEVKETKRWFEGHKLTINDKKCSIMTFGEREYLNKDFLGKNVQNVNKVTYLGIIMDHKLNYKSHVEKIPIQMSKFFGVFLQSKILLYKKSVTSFL